MYTQHAVVMLSIKSKTEFMNKIHVSLIYRVYLTWKQSTGR